MMLGAGDFQLLDLLYSERDTYLYRLGTLLSRIEDLSHVLAWSPCMNLGQVCLLRPYIDPYPTPDLA